MSGSVVLEGARRAAKGSFFLAISLGLLTAASALVFCPPPSAAYQSPALDRGKERMGHGDYDGAVNALGEAIGMNDKDATAYLLRGECFYKLQNFKLAIQDLNNSIQYAPNNARAFLVRGSCHAAMGEDDSAIADYEGAIKLDPALGRNFFRNGGNRAGQPGGPAGGQQGNTAGGGNGPRRARVQRRNGQAMIVADEGGSGAGLNLHAINDYKTAMHQVYPHGLRGGAEDSGDNSGGNAKDSDDTQGNSSLSPGGGRQANNGGSGGNGNDNGPGPGRRRRRPNQISTNTGGAVGNTLDPRQTDVQNNAGIEEETGISDRKKRFVHHLDQDPNRGVFGVVPGAGEFEGDAKEAVTDFTEVIRNNPNDPNVYYQRGKALQKLGRVDDALKDYNQAIQRDPQKSQYYIGRASVFYQLGKPLLCEAEINRARAVDPDVPGVVHFNLPKYPPSVKWGGGDGPGGH